jgi:DSF synthase
LKSTGIWANFGVGPSQNSPIEPVFPMLLVAPKQTLPTPSAQNASLTDLPIELTFPALAYDEMKVQFDPNERAAWCQFNPKGAPSFTRPLLRDMLRFKSAVEAAFGAAPAQEAPLRFVVGHSALQGVYNLGGDLTYFAEAIRAGNRAALSGYARECCEMIFNVYSGFGLPLIVVGLIEGDALGGGFESALSCNVLVAEKRARFGLPEIMFNLFPGMGAYSLLSRRVGAIKAEEMIASGRIYSAQELHALGLVDVLAEDGEGPQAVRRWISQNQKRHSVLTALHDVRRRVGGLTLQELYDITDRWVDEAMRLDESSLRRMERLRSAQARLRMVS